MAKVPTEKEHYVKESNPFISTHKMSVVVETEFDGGVKREEFIYMSIHSSTLSHEATTKAPGLPFTSFRFFCSPEDRKTSNQPNKM